MSVFRRSLAVLLLGLVAASSTPGSAHACDAPIFCSDDAAERIERADVLFRGRVLAFDNGEVPEVLDFLRPYVGALGFTITADFEVIEAWKGVETQTVRLYAESTSCGVGMWNLEPGTEMLVMASDQEGRLKAELCNGPISIEHELAQKMLAQLGPGERDLRVGVGYMFARYGFVSLVMFGLGLGWGWRRRAKAKASS